jgi:hypothetical protein
LATEVEMLKQEIARQTEQIYNLYKRIEELNEILKTRDTEQQKNI